MNIQSKNVLLNRTIKLSLLMSGLFVLTIISLPSAYAQRVQPMVFELEPVGSNSATSMRIENTKSVPMTLEFVVSKILLDEYGNETNLEADDDFLIFPPQALIKPGKTQIVKVKYVGEPDLEKSIAYRVSVKQLPVTLKDSNSTGVAMLVNFNTLANVVPVSSSARLSVTNLEEADDGKWALTIENSGSRFARLSKTQWTLSDSSSGIQKTLKTADTAALTEKNLVLPGAKLTQLVEPVEGFNPETTTITIR